MNTVLSFMDKIYGDSSTLSMIYIVGSILLFIFIILLIFSLRKPSENNKEKIIEEPNINPKEENEVKIESPNVEEKPVEDKEQVNPIVESINKPDEQKQENLSSILDKAEEKKEEIKEDEVDNQELPKLSTEIPNIDDYVDIINLTNI